MSNIVSHLDRHNILTECQFGFCAEHLNELQLLCTVRNFSLNLNDKVQIDVILLDLSKAFDKVLYHYPNWNIMVSDFRLDFIILK